MPKAVQAGIVLPPLKTQVVGSRVIIYDEIGSTNDRALSAGGDGTVIVADRQTAGRGRRGRPWHSVGGLGLWFSLALEQDTRGIAFAAPLAVRDAIRSDCTPKVKWPNDLLIDGKKVCGILVERREPVTVVGIGINVRHRTEDFPEELRGTATSLEMATGKLFDRGELLRRVLTALDRRVIVLRSGGFEDIWETWVDACAIRGRQIRHESIRGRVVDVDREGGLSVKTASGQARVLFGDVVELEDHEQ